MAVPFPDLDPYEVLSCAKEATAEQIKKSYRKLCLVHHPDKLVRKSEEEQAKSREQFNKVQFAFAVLSDAKRRARYDRTGQLEDFSLGDDDFSWDDYFSGFKVEINEEVIAKDKLEYQGSEEEKQDVLSEFLHAKGDFLQLFELIPHIEATDKDEQRLFEIVTAHVAPAELEKLGKWQKYQKNRKKLFKKYKSSIKDESKEAEELKKKILKAHENVDSEEALKQLIQKRQAGRIDSLIDKIESKYTKTGKKGKKTRSEYEIDDAEFDKIQKKFKR